MTQYVILRENPGSDPDAWHKVEGVFTASSAKRALTVANEQAGLKPGKYIAVPARSWRPLPVKVENTVKVTIG